ncbi:O-acetyltransferase [Photobacterium phosphoreum]|uniref:acyltransferase n=1 Tax=Photobacterium phosphoreum TaxID=659 RepID=UPI000D156B90|nr:acyltransferase [Photobacterium phosphoreum]PSW35767.1 O-acetyltransferase [Photobacterium phosphoreum]
MAYLTSNELKELNFKYLGNNVQISEKASIYNPELISIGNNSRVDDFCLLSGNIQIGANCHITPMCLVAGGEPGIIIGDFVALAYGVKVFSQSDDYSGLTMTNSTVPKKYKNEKKEKVIIEDHVIIGANSVIFPGVNVLVGTSVGACSLLIKSTDEWSIYIGNPAEKLKLRSKKILELEKQFKENKHNDSI